VAVNRAREREEQGRLFWVWLLSLPILLLMAAAAAFGTPWPNPLTQRIAMIMLAFPVIFVVGEPVMSGARSTLAGEGRDAGALVAAAAAVAMYASGVLSLITPAPPLAGLAALVVSTYLTLRYATGRY